jgi:hypothetical protein
MQIGSVFVALWVICVWAVLLYNLPKFWGWYGELVIPVFAEVADRFGWVVIAVSRWIGRVGQRVFVSGMRIRIEVKRMGGVR